jgi:hypothetical protein
VFRLGVVAGIACVCIAGCVSVTPTQVQTLPATRATSIPNASATSWPTPPPPIFPPPIPGPVADYGAVTPLFSDDFDDPGSGWGVGPDQGNGNAVSYGVDALEITTGPGHRWLWSSRETNATSKVIHVEAMFIPTGTGQFGLLCGSNTLWGATTSADGSYSFIALGDGTQTGEVLSVGQLDSLRVGADGRSTIALDCAGLSTGRARMQLYAPGTDIAVQYLDTPDRGAVTFRRAGVYAESDTDPFSASVDWVHTFGGSGAPSGSPQ